MTYNKVDPVKVYENETKHIFKQTMKQESKQKRFKSYQEFKNQVQTIFFLICISTLIFYWFTAEYNWINRDKNQELTARALATPQFNNIKISVSENQQWSGSTTLGKQQCRSTSITNFNDGLDNKFTSQESDGGKFMGKGSVYTNIFWFMSDSLNQLFHNQAAYASNPDFETLKDQSGLYKCQFSLEPNTYDQSHTVETEDKCYAKGFQLDSVVDPHTVKNSNKVCVNNFEHKENIEFGLQQVTCGAKQISKINGGNTQAKITIQPQDKGVAPDITDSNTARREWQLSNETDQLEDFYQDSDNFIMEIEIPQSMSTEGPQSEIGCVVAKDTGMGILARGPDTLNEPK